MSKLLAIGFSAGGIPLTQTLLNALGPTYPLPIVVITHLPKHFDSGLVDLFNRVVTLPVSMAFDKHPIESGHVYFAPPDYHLLIERPGYFALSQDARVKAVRPSIDVFLKSAAEIYEKDLLAVILSGANSDGADGMATVKLLGGVTIVLDPLQTDFRTMPAAVLDRVDVDYVASLDDIIALLQSVQES